MTDNNQGADVADEDEGEEITHEELLTQVVDLNKTVQNQVRQLGGRGQVPEVGMMAMLRVNLLLDMTLGPVDLENPETPIERLLYEHQWLVSFTAMNEKALSQPPPPKLVVPNPNGPKGPGGIHLP